MINFKLSFFLVILLTITSCSLGNVPRKTSFLNIKNFGAKGNGINDDRPIIQLAFNNSDTIYFPAGTYLLKSKTLSHATLYLNDQHRTRTMIFDSKAELKIADNFPADYHKPSVLHIRAKTGNIQRIYIEGLNIDGNSSITSLDNLGIVAVEEKRKSISNLILKNVTIRNVGTTGIHTQATKNFFNNIRTENCGEHGIGIKNTKNPHRVVHFNLNGHDSYNDKGYSIDFSGSKIQSDRSKLSHKEKYIGKVKNVLSKNSGYGIKTAGNWDLELKNIQIINSGNNGFFINHDAPDSEIILRNILVLNAKNNGLSLTKKTNVKGSNIKIEGCKVGIKIKESDVSFDSLLIDGKHMNSAGIRMGNSNVTLENFEIKNNNINDAYPIWVSGSQVLLRNGKIEDNGSPYGMIIHENANDVVIEKLSIKGKNLKGGILNLQKQGKTIIRDSKLPKMNSAIIDANKRIKLENSSEFEK